MLNNEKYNNFSCKEFFLYMLLLNRLNLSKKNRKHFCDRKGLFVFYTKSEIAKDLRCSPTTAINVLKNLQKAGLIEKEYQKNGLPLKIYVKDIRENSNIKTKPQDTSFNIESAIQNSQTNKYNFGEMKNPKIRHKKTT